MAIQRKAGSWTSACAIAVIPALGVAAGCSSGEQGSLVECIAPGAACCMGGACAIGLACELGVCVAADAGGAHDAGPFADGREEGAAFVGWDGGEGGDAPATALTDSSFADSSSCPAGTVCAMNAQGYMACTLSDGGGPVYTCGGSGPQGPPMVCPEGWVCGYVGQGGYCYLAC